MKPRTWDEANEMAYEYLCLDDRDMIRKRIAERTDAEIMRARSLASARGATPLEVQRNVASLEHGREYGCQDKTATIVNGRWICHCPK